MAASIFFWMSGVPEPEDGAGTDLKVQSTETGRWFRLCLISGTTKTSASTRMRSTGLMDRMERSSGSSASGDGFSIMSQDGELRHFPYEEAEQYLVDFAINPATGFCTYLTKSGEIYEEQENGSFRKVYSADDNKPRFHGYRITPGWKIVFRGHRYQRNLPGGE